MDGVYRVVNGLGRLALRGLGHDVRWSGVEHLPSSGPVVLAASLHVAMSTPNVVLQEVVRAYLGDDDA